MKEMYDNQMDMAGPMAFEKLLHIKYEDFPMAQAWLSAHDDCLRELAICGYHIPEDLHTWLLLRSLPHTDEMDGFKHMLGIIEVHGLDAVITHILEQEARLYFKQQDKELFVTKKEAGKRGKDGKTKKDKEGKGKKTEKTNKRTKCSHCK
jgi:hypothetical protein